MINQEILVEIFNENKGWEVLITSFGRNPIQYRPYIAINMQMQSSLVTGAVLTIGNPTPEIVKNIWGKKLRISIGYSELKEGLLGYTFDTSKIKPVFIGTIAGQAPYQVDSGKGTDQSLVIPLMIATLATGENTSFEENTSLDTALKTIFPDAKIKYTPLTLSTQLLQKPFIYNKGWTWTEIVNHFELNENILLTTNNMEAINVTTPTEVNRVMATSNAGSDSVAIIYNQPLNMAQSGIANTFIKTKYATISLQQAVDIELALVCTTLIGRIYAKIENIGSNINIFNVNEDNSIASSGVPSIYRVTAQHIVFSTFGDSSHTISLLREINETKK